MGHIPKYQYVTAWGYRDETNIYHPISTPRYRYLPSNIRPTIPIIALKYHKIPLFALQYTIHGPDGPLCYGAPLAEDLERGFAA